MRDAQTAPNDRLFPQAPIYFIFRSLITTERGLFFFVTHETNERVDSLFSSVVKWEKSGCLTGDLSMDCYTFELLLLAAGVYGHFGCFPFLPLDSG